MDSNVRRREFLKLTGAGLAGAVLGGFRGELFAHGETFASGGVKPNIREKLGSELNGLLPK